MGETGNGRNKSNTSMHILLYTFYSFQVMTKTIFTKGYEINCKGGTILKEWREPKAVIAFFVFIFVFVFVFCFGLLRSFVRSFFLFSPSGAIAPQTKMDQVLRILST